VDGDEVKPPVRIQSPARVRRELALMRAEAALLASRAKQLAKEYEEAHDAGIRSLRSGTGSIGGGGKTKGSHSDPTREAAGSYEYRRLQDCSAYAARRVKAARGKLGGAIRELTEALEALHGGWLDTDPDLREDRRAKREAAREIADGPAA
jgi:hypothetical protein